MSQYRPLRTGFWTDVKVANDFTPEDKYFYLALLTAPFSNILGAYELSYSIAALYLGYDTETVKRLLKRFEEVHEVIIVDYETYEIFIKNYHKYNWTTSNKFLKSIESDIDKIKSDKIKRALIQILLVNYSDYELTILKRYGIDRVSPTITNTITNTTTNTITNTTTNKGYGSDTVSIGYGEEELKKEILVYFNEFWRVYPKKQGKIICQNWFLDNPDTVKENIDQMLEAVSNHKLSKQWQDSKFIPQPINWLTKQQWNDELEIDEAAKQAEFAKSLPRTRIG